MEVMFLRLINFQGLMDTTSSFIGFQIVNRVDGGIYFWCDSVGTFSPANSTLLNTWHTVAFIMQNGNRQIWVDGTRRIADTKTTSASSHVVNSIWTGGGGPPNVSTGDLRIYNRVLSPNEIRLLATRPGIAYELAPRRRTASEAAPPSTFRRRQQYQQLVGGGVV